MQVEMGHVFFEFSVTYQAGVKLSVLLGLQKASYIQTDRSFQVIVTTVVNQNQKACSWGKYVLQDILSFESPLLPTSLLKLCSQIIWLDYTGARVSRIFFILINPLWTIFRLAEATTASSPTETDATVWAYFLFLIFLTANDVLGILSIFGKWNDIFLFCSSRRVKIGGNKTHICQIWKDNINVETVG